MSNNSFTFTDSEIVYGPNGVSIRSRRRHTSSARSNTPSNNSVPGAEQQKQEASSNVNDEENQNSADTQHPPPAQTSPSTEPAEPSSTPAPATSDRLRWGNIIATELFVDFMYETYQWILAENNNNRKHRIWMRIFALYKEYLVQHRQSSQSENLPAFAESLTLEAFQAKWGNLKAQYQNVVSAIETTGSGGAPGCDID